MRWFHTPRATSSGRSRVVGAAITSLRRDGDLGHDPAGYRPDRVTLPAVDADVGAAVAVDLRLGGRAPVDEPDVRAAWVGTGAELHERDVGRAAEPRLREHALLDGRRVQVRARVHQHLGGHGRVGPVETAAVTGRGVAGLLVLARVLPDPVLVLVGLGEGLGEL